MPRAKAAEPRVKLDLSVEQASVLLAILTSTGVQAARAKIAQGQIQEDLERQLRPLAPQPEESK